MTKDETVLWLQSKVDEHEKKNKKRKPWKQLTISELLFKLSLLRLALQTIANREERGWTVHQLSMRSGVKEKIIRNIENGKQFGVSISVLFNIAKAFGCAVDIKFVSIVDQVINLKEEVKPEDLVVPSFKDEITESTFNTSVNSGS